MSRSTTRRQDLYALLHHRIGGMQALQRVRLRCLRCARRGPGRMLSAAAAIPTGAWTIANHGSPPRGRLQGLRAEPVARGELQQGREAGFEDVVHALPNSVS